MSRQNVLADVRSTNERTTMGTKNQPVVDPTAWMIDNDVAHFLLLHQKEVMYMCMVRLVAVTTLRIIQLFSYDKPYSLL